MMRLALQHRFKLEVKHVEKAIKSPKESVDALKGVLSTKRIAKMKKEAVECPVLSRTVSFIVCFSCPNFLRRVKGEVHCKGDPLP